MGIVKGFSDILCPPNLAVNGSFRINQRNLFTSLTPAVSGDYVADAWMIHSSNNVDFLQVQRSFTYGEGSIRCKGYGRKGQLVYLYNNVPGEYNAIGSSSNRECVFTSSATFKGGAVTVPLKCTALGIITSGNTTVFETTKLLHSNELQEYVRIQKNPATINYLSASNSIRVYLMADGEFDFTVYNFRLFSGAFVNPPQDTQILYSDDLLRCKRYYQSGYSTTYGNLRQSALSYIMGANPKFEVEMAATPTITTNLTAIFEQGSDVNVVGNYSTFTGYITSKSFIFQAYKLTGGDVPQYMEYEFTASV